MIHETEFAPEPSSAKPEIKTQILFKSPGHMHINCSMSSVLCWIRICGVKGYTELFTEIWKLAQTCPHCQIQTRYSWRILLPPCNCSVQALLRCLALVLPKPLAHASACPLTIAGAVDLTQLGAPSALYMGCTAASCVLRGHLSSAWPRSSPLKTTGH